MPDVPYVPLTCEEVDCIESLDQWRCNKRVAIFGVVRNRDLVNNTVSLQSLGEGKTTSLIVDIRYKFELLQR